MIADKKSCDNCKFGMRGQCHLDSEFPTSLTSALICAAWSRHPNLWLKILPDSEGWYWWRRDNDTKPTVVELLQCSKRLCKTGFQVFISGSECWEFLGTIDGDQWQGPITPKESLI
jgi:hypothetical protein